MNLDGASGLYLLNLCVEKVVLVNETEEKRKSVCLQAFFWGLPMINIYQVQNPNEYDREPNVFTNFELGTTGYFHSATVDLIRSIQRHPIVITVYQNLDGTDSYEPVGTCRVKVTEKFSELISRAATCPIKHAVSGVIKGMYNVLNKEHIQVGTVSVNVRLVCYDNSLLKSPYVPPNKNNAVENVEHSKYLLPKKTSDGFVLVPAEGPGENFTESSLNEEGFPKDHENTWPQIPVNDAGALYPVDITGLVCDTTISERFFNAEKSNESFVSRRRGNDAQENVSYTVEHPTAKRGGRAEVTSLRDEPSARKMSIETYFSDSGTDTKRRDGGKITESATRIQDQKTLMPVKIFGKDGSAEGSRYSSLPPSPAQERSLQPSGSIKQSSADCLSEDPAEKPHGIKEYPLWDYNAKSTAEYILSAFAPRTGSKKSDCDPFNYEYSKASQRICEKYLQRRQEKANAKASKLSEKQNSQHQPSEMSFEQVETIASPIPSQFSCPYPTEEVRDPPLKQEYNPDQQNYPAERGFEHLSQIIQRTLSPFLFQPECGNPDTASRQLQRYLKKDIPTPSLRQQSFIRQNCVQDDSLEMPSCQYHQGNTATTEIRPYDPGQTNLSAQEHRSKYQSGERHSSQNQSVLEVDYPIGQNAEDFYRSRREIFPEDKTERESFECSNNSTVGRPHGFYIPITEINLELRVNTGSRTTMSSQRECSDYAAIEQPRGFCIPVPISEINPEVRVNANNTDMSSHGESFNYNTVGGLCECCVPIAQISPEVRVNSTGSNADTISQRKSPNHNAVRGPCEFCIPISQVNPEVIMHCIGGTIDMNSQRGPCNCNPGGGSCGSCVPVSKINPEERVKFTQSNKGSQQNNGWNAQENEGLEHQSGEHQERGRPTSLPYREGEDNEDLTNRQPRGAKELAPLYGIPVQHQSGTTDEVDLECKSCVNDRKRQGACILPADRTLGTEDLAENPTPQNAYGGTENEGPSVEYQPTSSENIVEGKNYSHPSRPFRTHEEESTQGQEKSSDLNTEGQTQHQSEGFQPYQKDSHLKHHRTQRSKGCQSDTRHSHARRTARQDTKQRDCSQQNAQVCKTKTKKPEGNNGDYRKNESGEFSQYPMEEQKCQEATSLGSKTGSADQANVQSCANYTKETAEQTSGWNRYCGSPHWQYPNNVCLNDDTKFDESSVVNATARGKIKQGCGVLGHLGDSRETRRFNQDVTPVSSSGNFDRSSRWHSVAQSIDTESIDSSSKERGSNRSSSDTESKVPLKATYSPRPATTTSCNAPKGFPKNRGQLQNNGYLHYNARSYYHDYRGLNLTGYGGYGTQTLLNACVADGCAGRCMWSNCHTC